MHLLYKSEQCAISLLRYRSALVTILIMNKNKLILVAFMICFGALFQVYTALAAASNDARPTVQATSTPPPELWHHLRSHFSLPTFNDNTHVNQQIEYYRANPITLNRSLASAEPYLIYTLELLEQRDLPLELTLLPLIESNYDPYAFSYWHAAGIWQIVPITAERFGVIQNEWYDGRRDIYQSTQAALDYLSYLHGLFDGDWLLALAAYNAGEGTVSRAMRRNRAKNQPTDFWHLDLPQQTQQYVPKLLALIEVVKNPSNVELPSMSYQPYLTRIDIGSQIQLSLVSELTNIPLQQLHRLNPGFNQGITPPDGPHYFLLPSNSIKPLTDHLQTMELPYFASYQYTVRPGDNLHAIATANQTTVNALKAHNALHDDIIYPDQTLELPNASPQHHVTEPGDSLSQIAQAYEVGTQQLATWNNLALSDTLPVGHPLTIWPTNAASHFPLDDALAVRRIIYPVRRGDSISLIAQRFNLNANDIRRWNTLRDNEMLYPGENLTLHVNVTQQF